MKKVFLLFLGTIFSMATMAQNTRVTSKMPLNHNETGSSVATNRGFGVKGGVNFSHLRGADKSSLEQLKTETTWHAGIYGQFAVKESKFFSIQTELLFNRNAFTVADTTRKIDSFDVPVLFVFNVLDNVSLHLGPQIGVLMTVKENDKEVGESTQEKMNNFTYGIAAGAEARVSFARLGLRYNLGLNDIYKEKEMLGNKAVTDLKNGIFQIYLGIGI